MSSLNNLDTFILTYVVFVFFVGCCLKCCSFYRCCLCLECCVDSVDVLLQWFQNARIKTLQYFKLRKEQRCTVIFPSVPDAIVVSSPYIVSLEYAHMIPDAHIVEEFNDP